MPHSPGALVQRVHAERNHSTRVKCIATEELVGCPTLVASLTWYNLSDGPSFGPTLIKKVMEGLVLQYTILLAADWPGYVRLSSGRMKPQVEGFVAFRYMPPRPAESPRGGWSHAESSTLWGWTS